MGRGGLGEFEQVVMLAVVLGEQAAGDDVYGVSIVDEIERRTGRAVSRASVYVTLRRLEDKGLVRSWMGEPTALRGGKARRHVALTASGRRALSEARMRLDSMWSGVRPLARGGRS